MHKKMRLKRDIKSPLNLGSLPGYSGPEHQSNDMYSLLKLLSQNINLSEVLAELVISAEQQIRGALGTIWLFNESSQRLTNGSSPNVPPSYVEAMEKWLVANENGADAIVACRTQTVIVSDMATDPLWYNFHQTALEHGLHACWSHPILGTGGEVLGIFALHFRQSMTPTQTALVQFETYAYLAGLAIGRQQTETSLRRLVYYDDHTGLPNRRWLKEYLPAELARLACDGNFVALAYLDLDRIKTINDSLGHTFGDAILRQISERLAASVSGRGFVARTGGDEFLLVVSSMTSVEEVAKAVLDVLTTTRQPIFVEQHALRVTASIGISLYPQHGQDAESVFKCADVAMYQAKSQGGNRALFYTTQISHSTVEDLQFAKDLSEALDRGELTLYFQPKYSLSDQRIVGAEALLRWTHPVHGTVSPGRFIPMLEETGDIVRVGEWVLRSACQQAKLWQASGNLNLRVSVNISARQFQTRNLSNVVSRILRETGLAPELLEIELTESTLIQNQNATVEDLKKLRELGVFISIDDFGTGYSSLSYLLQFRANTLKIDQTFIRNVASDLDSAIISSSIITLAHNLQMSVVAEGVETEEQFTFLAERACDEIQGYWLSPPLTPSDFDDFLSVMGSTGKPQPQTTH